MNDRVFRVAAVLSVFALIGMAGAGVAAAQDQFEVTDVDAPSVAPYDADIQVSVTVNNTGTSNGTANVTFAADGSPGNIAPGAPSQDDIQNYTTPDLNPGETYTNTLTINTSTDYGALTDGNSVNELYHGVYVNNSTGNFDDSAEARLLVGTNNTDGAVVAEVSDTNGQVVQGANVSLYVNTVSPANLIAENVTADGGPDNNRIRFSQVSPTKPESNVALTIGPNSSDPVEYIVRASKPGFSADNRNAELHENNVEETVFPELVPQVQTAKIQVVQNKEQAIADGEDRITFNITSYGDLNGDVFPNGQVTVDVLAGSGTNAENESVYLRNDDTGAVYNGNQTPVTFDTGNGLLNLSTNATEQFDVDYTFTAPDNSSAVVIGPNGNVESDNTRTKTFVLEGEGTVAGTVYDVDGSGSGLSERAIEDARVWAVQKDRFSSNSISVSTPAEGDTDFYRIREAEVNETTGALVGVGEILDVTQDYRIDNNGSNTNLSISRVRELNVTNSSQGSGWAVRTNNASATEMFVTPLEPGYYVIERSDTAPNSSDERFVDATNPSENFVSTIGLPGYVAVNADLTYSAAQQLSSISGQQLNDTTDAQGDYVLDNLYTDFQAGVDYTIIADKAGYEVEFIDPLVTENGAYFQDGGDENFALRQIEEDVEVNVTNYAALPSVNDAPAPADRADLSAYSEYAFDNTTDAFAQEVPRDGNTVDVLQVETQTESGLAVNETVQISVPDVGPEAETATTDAANFTGEFIAVAGGTEVSSDDTNATITVAPGADGEAVVWLQSDLDDQNLISVPASSGDGLACDEREGFDVFSGVVAQSTQDAGAIDATCKDFVGTVIFQPSELSGVVTNQNNNPVESEVFIDRIQLSAPAPAHPDPVNFSYINNRVDIDVDLSADGNHTYSIRHVADEINITTGQDTGTNGVFGNDTGLTYDDLTNYDGFGTTTFPQIAVAGSAVQDGFTLATNSDDVDDPTSEDSTYTLPRVPAESPTAPVTGVTPTGIDAQLNTGSSVQTGMQVGRTSTANIEISTAAELNVTSVNAPDSVQAGDDLTVDAGISNDGGVTVERDITYTLENESGDTVAEQTETVLLAGGETTTVTYTVDTTGLDAGNYTSTVDAQDDTGTAVTEVTDGGNGDNGGNGTLPADNAFGDSNDDPVDRQTAIDRIISWNDNGEIDGTAYTRDELINDIIEWNAA